MLKTKSVHSPIARTDGLRILATRFRGRGLPAARYDVWMASLGPSEKLLATGRVGEAITWAEFTRLYREEIGASVDIDASNRSIKNYGQKWTLRLIKELARRGNVTIMCHCDEDETRCHRHLLKKMIEGA
jgi:uncharacterized protein YeaO (DUF488 family)